MLLMNWLAKKDGNGGLALPSELASGNVRIYGEVYGNPNFSEGEYVQTAVVISYDGFKVRTISGNEYVLIQEHPQYSNFLNAVANNTIVLKYWNIKNGRLVGKTMDAVNIEGKVVSQSLKKNICLLKDGRKVFVDWLSKAEDNYVKPSYYKLLVFCIENCMPDILGHHYHLFRERS